MTTMIAYTRTSTKEQGDSGLGLAAQRASIEAGATNRGWTIDRWYEDPASTGKNLDRPHLVAALGSLEKGEADGIIVAKLDRLSRSLFDFAGLLNTAKRGGWNIVALDLGVDTTTPGGEMMAGVVATFAQYERRLISERTKDALAAKKAQGVVLGCPVKMDIATQKRIFDERRAGKGWTAISDGLNADGVPTAQGGKKWHPSTVRATFMRLNRK